MKTEKKVKMIFQKANEKMHISEVEKSRTQELLAGQMEDYLRLLKSVEIRISQVKERVRICSIFPSKDKNPVQTDTIYG